MASGAGKAFLVVIFAALVPLLYSRSHTLSTFYTNSPHRLVRVNTAKSYDIKFQDRIRSCEDAFLVEKAGLAILACDPGREKYNTVMNVVRPGPVASAELFAYDYATEVLQDADSLKKIKLASFPAEAEADLHTLGMGYDEETSTLFVTNHARSGIRIEKFKLDTRELVATHLDTISHPLLYGANSIFALSGEEILVTNDHHFTAKRSPVLSQLETYLALPLSTVVHVNLKGGEVDAHVVARLPFANGIEVLNSTTVAVASSSKASVLFYTRDGSDLKYHSEILTPFLPDNLSSAGGKLLIAGHAHMPTLAKFADSRHICNDPTELSQATAEMKEYCKTGTAPSWVSEWSEIEGLKHVYVGDEYPSSSTFVRDVDRKVGIIVGLYAKGIMVLRD
ncbi:uncharacterized protein DNG_08985 [Cephalotrichum gorgonifer]|uniref:Paraoxonase n=1 Tax=Cephalotrichum gorgonifer TaxID=2041049 RepID=A0AAE8N4R7_9PEZI|nr:uncharacterized protein DNG_08985 [Cephalotrichum gorgonifer]